MKRDDLTLILFDSKSYEEEREEAAGYMSYFPDEDSLKILKKVASNPLETEFVKGKAGESIGIIMLELNRFDKHFLENISNAAYNEIVSVIKNKRPEWCRKYEL